MSDLRTQTTFPSRKVASSDERDATPTDGTPCAVATSSQRADRFAQPPAANSSSVLLNGSGSSATTPLWLDTQEGALHMAFSVHSSDSGDSTPRRSGADDPQQNSNVPSSTYEDTIAYLESLSTDSACTTPPQRWWRGITKSTVVTRRVHSTTGYGLQEHVAAEVIQGMFRRHQLRKRHMDGETR